jgi:hypothetical protein
LGSLVGIGIVVKVALFLGRLVLSGDPREPRGGL